FVGDGQDAGRQWQIPLNSNYDAVPTLLKDESLNLGDYQTLRQTSGEPFRLNVGNNSHFIVQYDDTLLQDILANVNALDEISQLQLLQDLRLLAEGRRISYAAVVPLLQQFADSKYTVVTSALYTVAGNLRKFVTPDAAEEEQM